MKKVILLTVLGVLFIAGTAALSQATTVTLSIEASGGAWSAYAEINPVSEEPLEYDCDGIASFIIDVEGVSGDVAVTGSLMAAPFGFDSVQFAMFGFATRGDGTNGIGIYAGQPTMYDGGNDPNKDALVLLDVGISAGGPHYGVSWSAPVLLASGTYTGSGDLRVALGDGYFNVLDSDWEGPGGVSHADEITPDTVTIEDGVVIPEPATLGLLGLALIPLIRRKTN